MSDSSTVEVTNQAGKRLDVVVAGLKEGLTRAKAQTLIRDGNVLVNGSTSKPSTHLNKGDRIRLSVTDAPPADTTPEPLPLSIVYEDNHVVVVNKPAGLTVHPAPGHAGGTLANALLARLTDSRMHLRLESQRQTRRGDTVETLEIRIGDELGTRSYELFSGGEAFRINFALRVALAKLLASRTGAPLRTPRRR